MASHVGQLAHFFATEAADVGASSSFCTVNVMSASLAHLACDERPGEHLVRGGDRYLGYTEGMRIRRNRTRAVAGLSEGQKLNKSLWALAGEFPQN